MNKCKKCKKDVESSKIYPENELCKDCYKLFKEKALKCQSCEVDIDWHNYHWHNRLCDKCFGLISPTAPESE